MMAFRGVERGAPRGSSRRRGWQPDQGSGFLPGCCVFFLPRSPRRHIWCRSRIRSQTRLAQFFSRRQRLECAFSKPAASSQDSGKAWAEISLPSAPDQELFFGVFFWWGGFQVSPLLSFLSSHPATHPSRGVRAPSSRPGMDTWQCWRRV